MNKEEFNGEEMLEAMTKLRPEKLNENTRELFYTIMKIIDERDSLLKEKEELQEDIENYRASVQALKVELGKKDKTIKKAIDFTKDHIFQFAGDKDFEFLLQILERTDK